ncbi:MAG TPA: trehalose-6-phosphate synthase [Micavibrio sp.]|nr:trehalose-6-phosphate synthase [Micavibrio sp.]
MAQIAREYPIHLDNLPGSKVVIVATRAPRSPMSGGMAPAVKQACKGFDYKFWYAYGVPEKESGTLTRVCKAAFNAFYKKTVPISAFDVEGFRVRQVLADDEKWDLQYNQYANRLVWPLSHNLGEFAKEMEHDDTSGNRSANETIAKRIKQDLNGDKETPIWIHDYHHLPLADTLRRLRVQNPIMYFHHIPLPTLETLGERSESERIHFKHMANALRACDAVLFQTEEVAKRFYDIIGHVAPQSIPAYSGQFINSRNNGRGKVFIGHAPISINTDHEMAIAVTPALKTERAKELDKKLVGGNIFINFERCDYSKGIIPRVRAFEELLKKRPELRGNAQLVLGAEPTRGNIREYQQYADEVDRMVQRLNRDKSLWCQDVPPVIFSNENIDHDDVIRLMRNRKEGQRRIGLVTPHEDGMNLTAKEFAAAQDPRNAGPLVISSGAGAAGELGCDGKGALVYSKIKDGNVGELVDVMVRAVYMPQSEADARAAVMQKHLKEYNIQKWASYHRGILERIQAGTFTQPRPAAKKPALQPILAAE